MREFFLVLGKPSGLKRVVREQEESEQSDDNKIDTWRMKSLPRFCQRLNDVLSNQRAYHLHLARPRTPSIPVKTPAAIISDMALASILPV